MATVRARSGGAGPLEAESGCLLIADIGGYTGYVVDSPLAYAEDVLADLTDTVARHLAPVFRLNKREGDAIFGYALAGEVDATMLLDAVDDTYFSFRSRVDGIGHATSCDCKACTSLPALDLKFVVHSGDFIRRHGQTGEELTGSDVILVHRLLKNDVSQAHRTTGYALLTAACVEALELDPVALGLREHREDYEHVGTVPGFVLDLEARRREALERRRVLVSAAEAAFELETLVALEPPAAWEYLTAPAKRTRWSGLRVTETTSGGRRGEGTTTLCVDGRHSVYEEILDWRPFDYFSERRSPGGAASVVLTTTLEGVPGGTRVVARGRWDGGRIGRLRGARRFVRRLEEDYDRLAAVVAADAPEALVGLEEIA
jgi:uncharacterized protein YndB with AHSA1/START domain